VVRLPGHRSRRARPGRRAPGDHRRQVHPGRGALAAGRLVRLHPRPSCAGPEGRPPGTPRSRGAIRPPVPP
jgi:hypothetical protein